MSLIDLSHPLATGMAVYPGDETTPVISRLSSHGEGRHQSSAFATGCHAGTHIDLPLHFRAGEPALEDFPPERCEGAAVVLDAPEGAIPPAVLAGADLGAVDFVLLRTGWARHWGSPQYYREWPWLTEGTALLLAEAGLKGVGLDSPSIDPFGVETAHHILAAAGLINIENLAALDLLPAAPFRFAALPLRLAGAEASPVRAVAWVGNGGVRRGG